MGMLLEILSQERARLVSRHQVYSTAALLERSSLPPLRRSPRVRRPQLGSCEPERRLPPNK
eukprot:4564303-Prorocentrum_lima.AAC.1